MKPNFFLAALFTTLYPLFVSAQPWDFAKRYSAALGSTLTNSAVATAPDGSTYLVGSIRGTATFDGISATTPAGVTQYYLLKMNPNSQAVWVQTFDQKAYHVTTDPQGNVFIAGAIAAGSPASDSLTYVAKYDANGQLLADFESSGSGKSLARVVRTDSAGNCYVTGWKTGVVTFGATTPPNQGSRDNFLVKLSPDLAQVNWAVNTGSSNNLDEVYDLELDDNSGIYTSGNYSQTFSLGCFCYNGSFFAEKRSTTNGALIWQKLYSGGSGTTTQQVVSLSSDGQSLYTAASFKNTTTINPGVSLTAQSGTDDYHLFATNLNAVTGTVQWAKKISFTGDSYITGMAQADDKLHLHGYFKSNTLIGSVLLEPLGTFDAFYAQVTPATGDVANAEKFTGNSTDQGFGIASGGGRLAVSGNAASSTLTIGTFNLTGNSSSIYVAGKIYDVPLNISLANVTNASCPGVADGSATVSAQGGTAPYTYLWSNGQMNATAINLAAGTYTVTVTDNAGVQISISVTITEPPALTVGFTNSVNALTASFSNTSANATSYSWNFGDGQISAEINPSHTYASCGTYTVTLIAANDCGSNTSTSNITIGNGLPTAGFTNAVNDLATFFTNTSTNATSYSWNFGDGQISAEINPSHTYASCGTYTVTLIAANDCGSNTSTSNITIGNGLPTAGFTNAVNGLATFFTNTSTNATSYSWNFGDGQTSTQANPAHTYANCGNYTVTLTATNFCGTNVSTLIVPIGNGLPGAGFTSSINGLAITFSNTSANTSSYFWDFGDGNTSTQVHPVHTYAECGTYTVTMTASNLCGDDVSTATVTIGIGDPVANFSSSVDSLTATFSNTSTNATSYLWNFGDGQTSPEAAPMHTYTNAGTYTVSLIATNICGADTFSQTVTISPVGVAPVADFTADKMVVCVGDTVRFTNLTSNGESFVWWFPGAEPMNSTETNPVVVYVMPGEYVVALTASNPFGDDHEMKEEFIIVLPLPIADFGVDTNGLTVVLTDSSQHADSYEWDFGDGHTLNTSADTIEHTYGMPGIYTIRLTIQNQCGVSILEKTVAVGTVGTETATWLDAFRLFPNPNNGAFALEMSGEAADDVEFSLFSPDGRLLRRETADFGNGVLIQPFDYSDLPPALYLLRIRAGEKTAFEKVVIQR